MQRLVEIIRFLAFAFGAKKPDSSRFIVGWGLSTPTQRHYLRCAHF